MYSCNINTGLTRTHLDPFNTHRKLSFEVVLAPKGKLEQPLESSLRGLDWKLSFKDIYATGRLEFKIGACRALIDSKRASLTTLSLIEI